MGPATRSWVRSEEWIVGTHQHQVRSGAPNASPSLSAGVWRVCNAQRTRETRKASPAGPSVLALLPAARAARSCTLTVAKRSRYRLATDGCQPTLARSSTLTVSEGVLRHSHRPRPTLGAGQGPMRKSIGQEVAQGDRQQRRAWLHE